MERAGEITSLNQGLDRYTTLTISSNALTIPGAGLYVVMPETGLTDDLETIVDACKIGAQITLVAGPSCTITLKSGTGNITALAGEDFVIGPNGVHPETLIAQFTKAQVNPSVIEWVMSGAVDESINMGASTAPGVTDDLAHGYRVGSRWIDTAADLAYTCVDSTTGAAVWITGTSGHAALTLGANNDAALSLVGQALTLDLSSILKVAVRSFTETAVAGTYTATVALLQNAVVKDVRWSNQVLWTNNTSATLNVGDDDDADGYFAAVDLKTAPIADLNGAGGISCFAGDAGAGAYAKLTKRCATAKTLTATIVTVGATGNAGRSRLAVMYCVPPVVTATKA